MSIAWGDPVRFSWEGSQWLLARTMSLGSAIEYFSGLSPEQKACARISLSSPLQLVAGLPAAYELDGIKIDAVVALRRSSEARLAA